MPTGVFEDLQWHAIVPAGTTVEFPAGGNE